MYFLSKNATCRRLSKIRWSKFFVSSYHSGQGVFGHKPWPIVDASPDFERQHQGDARLLRLVDAYRADGHRKANLDPLQRGKGSSRQPPELSPALYGLKEDQTYDADGVINGWTSNGRVGYRDVVKRLDEIYCGSLAAEFLHLETLTERQWFARKFETLNEKISITKDDKRHYAKIMLECQNFDHFLATKFGTVKRYGGEGSESMMPYFYETFRHSVDIGIREIITCMPHRGRLNLLTTLLDFPAVVMFRKMKGKPEFPSHVKGLGDVLSHLTTSVDLVFDNGKIHFTMLPNPSHLEANNPVAVGKARGRMQSLSLGDYSVGGEAKHGDGVLCFQVHGDASFTGQGVVAETFALSKSPHYTVGGSVHLIVNNQIGFTTEAERGRSSEYCSDMGKSASCPILHVNADYPEDVARAARLALDYRDSFRKDVVVDLICFRRWGHNELDDPTFTQPIMYDIIENRPSIPDAYANKLEADGLLSKEERQKWIGDHTSKMNDQLKQVDTFPPVANHLEGRYWSSYSQAPSSVEVWDTGVATDLLKFIGAKSVQIPEKFAIHSHLKKTHCDARLKKVIDGENLDWATAEALAFGSLLYQGIPVRISGQDVGRGTFSNRHAMLIDQSDDSIFIPLNEIIPDQKAFLEVCNSILSEEAVLGFEYGMAVENPNRLVIWEAQFGDFFNAAQTVIDTYLSSGESKWLLQNGLVMLLPHGFDGAGPEHSSSRLERFLQLTDSKENAFDADDVNMHIVHPTTSAQYFHLLRRQVMRNYRKPLIVASPKILLRHSAASSALHEMAPGTCFRPVLPDEVNFANTAKVTKVIFCSGKHYYALTKHRETNNANDVAIVRLEALCPFPASELQGEIKKYTNATSFVWSQEEPRNAGPWSFVRPRFQNLVGCNLRYAGRPELPIVAVAIGEYHQREHDQVIRDTFA